MKKRPEISVCMIVKNELENLPVCLDSIVDYVDEIIVVDTGSTDGTQSLLTCYPKVKISSFEWNGSFSDARNYSMSLATKDWIMIIDADDRAHPDDWGILLGAISDDRFQAVIVDVLNVYDKGNCFSRLSQTRLFRRNMDAKYEGKVHNQLTFPNHDPKNIVNARVPFRIYHVGYGMLNEEALSKKLERALGMTEQYTIENPDDGFGWLNYAQALRNNGINNGNAKKIEDALNLAVIKCNEVTQGHIITQSCNVMAWLMYVQKRFDEAISWSERALSRKRDYLDAMLIRAYANMDKQNIEEAEFWLKEYLKTHERYKFEQNYDGVTLEQVNQKSRVYQALASIEEFRLKTMPEYGVKL